jgi:hypothetical protein
VGCQRWRFCAKNPEYRFDLCVNLVFWCSGLALAKMRFLFWGAAFLSEKSRIPFLGLIRFSRTSIAAGTSGGGCGAYLSTQRAGFQPQVPNPKSPEAR